MRFITSIFAPGLIAVSALLLALQGEAGPIAAKADASGSLPLLGQFHVYVDFEELANPPRQWQYLEPALSSNTISLRIDLKLQNVERFQQMVIDLSTPGHPTYGQHMTQDEINAIINPSKESAQLVLEWLSSSGIDAVHDGQSVRAEITIAQAQVLLQTRFNVYLNTLSSKKAIRTLSYRLPEILKNHIDLVQPTTMFGLEPLIPRASQVNLKRRADLEVKESEPSLAGCDKRVTPQCLRQLYNMKTFSSLTKDNASIAVAGFLGEYGNRADLQTFFKEFRPDFLGMSYSTIKLLGGLDDQSVPGTEANLDIQYAAALANPGAVTYYSVGEVKPEFTPDKNTPTNTNEPYKEFLEVFLAAPNIPTTLSISYADYEQTVPKSYADRVCNLFAQLGARGTTVLVASGDYGVGGNSSATSCLTNDGRKANRFLPLFPASCPFVTSVGGTVGMAPERAVALSGGGFSEYFKQPVYQQNKVSAYLSNLGPKYSGLFNPTGRAYPDVAAQGKYFQVVVNGTVESIGGTSASTPVFAAIVWNINNQRQSQGKPSLGFLNPFLYSNPQVLNDIVSGNNPGCGTEGFYAAVSWDPVTGLGTPDLSKLMAALAS